MQYTVKNFLPHLFSILLFFIVAGIFYYPVFEGKKLVQSDVLQVKGYLKEANDFEEKSDESILWSNSAFSGMPVWRGFETSIFDDIHEATYKTLSVPIAIGLFCYVGFYVLMLAFNVNPWISTAAAFAYTFSSFTIISFEAGHINKVFDMALMAPVLAGVIFLYKQRYWKGSFIVLLAGGLLVFYGHIQIIYYLLIVLLFYAISQFIIYYKKKNLKPFFIASALAIVSALIAAWPSYSRLIVLQEYAESTTRAGSELASEEAKGLSTEYIFSWSYGIIESFTFLIPDLYGGSSNEDVGLKSESYQTLIQGGVPRNQAKQYVENLPTYWGEQPFTSGPVYLGAVVVFLFVLGITIVKSPTRWWVLGASVLALLLAWGKNLEWFNLFFYNYVPLYNKFRSVTMVLTILQITFPLLGFIALKKVYNKELSKKELFKGLKIALLVTGGLSLFFLVLGPAIFDFQSASDSRLPEWLRGAIIEDRKNMLTSDALRSLLFVLATFALLWFYLKDKVSSVVLFSGIIGLTLVDLFPVAKRYVSEEDFVDNEKMENRFFLKSEIDTYILQDPDPYYRVFNLTVNPFSDATTSYYHKSIGGYSAIKLGRYQDLIDHHLSENNQKVINMLNTKYIIFRNQQGQEQVRKNPAALGNAWFVSDYRLVEGPQEEIDALDNFNPRAEAIVAERFEELVQVVEETDTSGTIKLTEYHPNYLKYKAQTPDQKIAVFSEIFYEPGWQAYIDGEPVEHFRVNYVLRGLVVPEGEHTITFRFKPETYVTGEKVSLWGSIVWVIASLATLGLTIFKGRKEEKEEE